MPLSDVAPLMSVPAPSGVPDPAPCRAVPVTPLSGSAGMEVAAATNPGCISNRVTIPFSSTLVTGTVTLMGSAAPSGPVAVTVTVWLDLVS